LKKIVLGAALLFCGSLFATPVLISLPQHHFGLAYGQAFYVVSDAAITKLSLSGKAIWAQSSLYSDSRLFIAFNKVYLYGPSGISEIDSDIGAQRWHRPLSGLRGLSHHYPYLVAETSTQHVYIHPDTGLTIMTVSASVREAARPTMNVLSDGKTVLTITGGLLTLRAVDAESLPIVQLDTGLAQESVESYIWAPPTLSLMTASQIVFWPHVGRGSRVVAPLTPSPSPRGRGEPVHL